MAHFGRGSTMRPPPAPPSLSFSDDQDLPSRFRVPMRGQNSIHGVLNVVPPGNSTPGTTDFTAKTGHTFISSDSSADDETDVVVNVRTLLGMLSTVGTFGASLALGAVYGARQVEDSAIDIEILAWSFASFTITVVVSLLWQLALLGKVVKRPYKIRWFRSDTALIGAAAACITFAVVGLLLSAVAILQAPILGARVVGFTMISVIVVPVLVAFLRYIVTIRRRRREISEEEEIGNAMGVFQAGDRDVAEFLVMYERHGAALQALQRRTSGFRKLTTGSQARLLYCFLEGLQNRPVNMTTPTPGHFIRLVENWKTWHFQLQVMHATSPQFFTRALNKQVEYFNYVNGVVSQRDMSEIDRAAMRPKENMNRGWP